MKKFLFIFFSLGLLIIIALVCFIKFDTPAAAMFTDNYLRPLLGNGPVGFMEKVYYNTSDKLQQLTDKTGIKDVPQFVNDGIASHLTPIQTDPGLPPIKGEGIWHDHPLKLFPGLEVMADAFIRPDPTRPYAFVTLVQMDMSRLRLSVVAGTKQPGGPAGNPGPGIIPADIINSGNLVAAFDGGFQYKDGQYGMIVGGKTYLPLIKNIGTLVGLTDGTLKIIDYTGQDLGPNVAFISHNCPLLIENGQVTILDEKNKKLWGRTFNADIFTWRSGIGLTQNGNLIYAVGNNLSPASLSYALKMAGAVNAIQLDINSFWVRFNIFESNGSGGYTTHTLTKNLADGSKGYLKGYTKDFFYIYKK